MISYNRHPDIDFTHFVSAGYTGVNDFLKTVSEYAKEGMTTRELFDFRQQANLFKYDEIDTIFMHAVTVQVHRPPKGKTAILVNGDIKSSFARHYASQTPVGSIAEETQVFVELGQAIEWLGQDVAQCL